MEPPRAAGFWLWQVRSKEEAIEWVKRCPNPLEGDSEIEIQISVNALNLHLSDIEQEEDARPAKR